MSKVCNACDFRTLNNDQKVCAKCGEKFVAKVETDAEKPAIAKAAEKIDYSSTKTETTDEPVKKPAAKKSTAKKK